MIASYVALARYNRWMNEKLYACAAELSEDERNRDLGAFFGSLHGTLSHLLLADRIWLGRFTKDPGRFLSDAAGKPIAVKGMNQVLYSSFEDLRREREKTDRDIEDWIAGVDEAALEAPFPFKSVAGAAFEPQVWVVVTHFFNHQTHHRGQATTLLMQLGKDPGPTDFLAMMLARD